MSTLERLVPIEDVAKHFTVSISTVRAWVRQGLIPKETYIRIGNTYRFSIPKILEAVTKTPTEEPTPSQLPVQLELDLGNPDKDL
jgi:hypothetical protein